MEHWFYFQKLPIFGVYGVQIGNKITVLIGYILVKSPAMRIIHLTKYLHIFQN